MTVFISVTGGLLLLFAWMQNRNTPALAMWGTGYLVGAAGAALLAGRRFVPNSWSVCGANALLCTAYGCMWSGARSFEGRRVCVALLAAGAAHLDRRLPVRKLRAIDAGAHQSGRGDQRLLRGSLQRASSGTRGTAI